MSEIKWCQKGPKYSVLSPVLNICASDIIKTLTQTLVDVSEGFPSNDTSKGTFLQFLWPISPQK